MANVVYHQIFQDLMAKAVSMASGGDVFKLALFTSSKAIQVDDVTYSNTNELATANNYTQGGYAFTNTNNAATDDDGNDRAIFDINEDASWSNATLTARYAQLYDNSVSNHLVCCFDFGSDQTSTAGTFKVVFNSIGVMTLS